MSDNSLLQKENLSLKKIIAENKYQTQLSLANADSTPTGKSGPLMLAYFDPNEINSNNQQALNNSSLTMTGNSITLNGIASNQPVLQKILNALISSNSVQLSGFESSAVYLNNNNNINNTTNDQSRLNSLN
jgi:hypothetical protein